MKDVWKMGMLLVVCPIIFNVLVVSTTLLLHEAGHFFIGMLVGCKNVKLVLFDSALGTYTEMNCPNEQQLYFPLIGSFLFALPFFLLFLILTKFPERNFFWISLGFNFLISVSDIPPILPLDILQIVSFGFGFILIIYGEIILIDKLILFIHTKV